MRKRVTVSELGDYLHRIDFQKPAKGDPFWKRKIQTDAVGPEKKFSLNTLAQVVGQRAYAKGAPLLAALLEEEAAKKKAKMKPIPTAGTLTVNGQNGAGILPALDRWAGEAKAIKFAYGKNHIVLSVSDADPAELVAELDAKTTKTTPAKSASK